MASAQSSQDMRRGHGRQPQILGNAQPRRRSESRRLSDHQGRPRSAVTRECDHCLHVGDAVKVFSVSANAWMDGEVVNIPETNRVEVSYVVRGDPCRKNVDSLSEHLRTLSPNPDTPASRCNASICAASDPWQSEAVTMEMLEGQLENRLLEKLRQHIAMLVEEGSTEAWKQLEVRVAQLEERLQSTRPPVQHNDAMPDGLCSDMLNTASGQESIVSVQAPLAASPRQSRRRHHSLLRSLGAGAAGEVAFTPSIWDASLLLGTNLFGMGGSISVALALLVHIGVSTIFCGAVLNYLTQPAYDAKVLEQLKSWRLNSAHMFTEADHETGISLASRACNADRSLSSSALQFASIVALNAYLPKSDGMIEIIFSGPAMCIVALLVWYFALCTDLQAGFDLCSGLLGVPRGATTDVTILDRGFQLTRMSSIRKVLVCVITSLRLSTWVVLAYSGTLLLVHTTVVKDLVLGCMSLGVILNMDEVAFSSLVPSQTQFLLKMLRPVNLPDSHRRLTHIVGPAIKLAAIGVSLALVCSKVLVPYVDVLKHAKTTLCGGELDFVVIVESHIGVPSVGCSPSFDTVANRPADTTLVQRAIDRIHGFDIREIVWPREEYFKMDPLFGFIYGCSRWSEFKTMARTLPSQSGPQMSSSEVDPVHYAGGYVTRLSEALASARELGWTSVTYPSCANAYSLCTDPENNFWATSRIVSTIVYLCPGACGCASPLHGHWNLSYSSGCPPTFLTDHRYHEDVSRLPCTDDNMQNYHGLNCSRALQLLSDRYVFDDIDQNYENFPRLKPLCPMAYGCKSEPWLAFCPQSCSTVPSLN